jgi:hypothetical protein
MVIEKCITVTTSLTRVLSIDTLARLRAPTDDPIHDINANLARLLNSSPVYILKNANERSSSSFIEIIKKKSV